MMILLFTYDFEVAYSDKLISNLKTEVGAEFGTDMYSFNHIKNWSNYSFSLRQEITKSTSFSFSYSYIPTFYVRHFYDDDWTYYYGFVPEAFQPYDFSKDDYSFWVQQYSRDRNTRVKYCTYRNICTMNITRNLTVMIIYTAYASIKKLRGNLA